MNENQEAKLIERITILESQTKIAKEENTELIGRVATLEKRINNAIIYAKVLSVAFLIAFGFQYYEIPKIVEDEAKQASIIYFSEQAEDIASKMIAEKIDKIIDYSDTGSKVKDAELSFIQIKKFEALSKEVAGQIQNVGKNVDSIQQSIKKIEEDVSVGKFVDLEIKGKLSVNGVASFHRVKSKKIHASEHILVGGGGVGVFIYSDKDRNPSICIGHKSVLKEEDAKRYGKVKFFAGLNRETGMVDKIGF